MPNVDLSLITIGEEYSRDHLAKLWDYKGRRGLESGVITPGGKDFIILFVTLNKRKDQTQYRDRLEKDILFWEGQDKHRSDDRIINSRMKNESIHLLLRTSFGQPFTYLGRLYLKDHKRKTDEPSKFEFKLLDSPESKTYQTEIRYDTSHLESKEPLSNSEKQVLKKIRDKQQKFKDNLIRAHGLKCMISGSLIGEIIQAAHIVPYSDSLDNRTSNGLLLRVDLHNLFDSGLLGINPDTLKVKISPAITEVDYRKFDGVQLNSDKRKLSRIGLAIAWERFLTRK